MKEKPPVMGCLACMPDMTCKAIGTQGKIAAREILIPVLHQRFIIWEKIEDCFTRKLIMEELNHANKEVK